MEVRKVAIVHDWLTGMRGGEKVLETFVDMFPSSEIFTLIFIPENISDRIKSRPIHTSSLQRLPFAKKKYRFYLPLMPSYIESFDLSQYDLIISCSHCVAKGVLTHPGQIHLSYIFTPMRYIWDQYWNYFQSSSKTLQTRLMKYLATWLRTWDVCSNTRVDHFVTISNFVKERIKKYYNRDAEVIYPPVDINRFKRKDGTLEKKENFYLIVSALVPYKRLDTAIKAFNHTGLPLKIIGTGPEYKRLKRMAKNNIEFLKFIPDKELVNYYRKAKAFIFTGVEDFGMTMVESIASGTPVVAYRAGGAREIVIEGTSGVFYDDRSVACLKSGIKKLDEFEFKPYKMFDSVRKFSIEAFKKSFYIFLNSINIEI